MIRKILLVSLAALICGTSVAQADFAFTTGTGATAFSFTASTGGTSLCAASVTHCFASVPINTAGTAIFTTTSPGAVGGTVASGAADSGNPLKVGCKFVVADIGLANGNRSDCQADSNGNIKTSHGIASQTLSAWTSASVLNALQTLMVNHGAPAILVQFNQTTTISAGAITFQGTYDGTNWTAIPDAQVLNPNTLANAGTSSGIYTLVASTNKPFLLLVQGYQSVRINLSTQITGTGSVTPFVTLLNYNPAIGALLNPLSAGSAIIGKVGVDQTTPGTTNGVSIVGVNAATALAGNGATGTGSPRVTIADNNSPLAVTQSGTWNVTNVSGSVSLPTGASTAAKQPALGTAGSASTDVLSVQGIASMTPLLTNPQAATTGGCTPSKTLSAASTNATSVKGSAGTLCKMVTINTTATLYYLKTYNTSSAPTCNSDTVVATYPIPPSNGGVAVPIGPFGEAYTTGIGFCLTAGIADNDNANAATGVAISYSFK